MYKFQTSRGPDQDVEGTEGEGNGDGVSPPQLSRRPGEWARGPQSSPPGISIRPARSPRNVKNDEFVSIRCVFSSSKIHQTRFLPGLHPGPHL